jgi:hypothetical protein
MTNELEPPIFEPRELADGSGFDVLVTWADNHVEHINQFLSFDDAQTWIDVESHIWLGRHPRTHLT